MPTWDGITGTTGYRHAAYAQSLVEVGTPRSLTRCGGWILEREIANAGARDGMGCYPLFACRDWGSLGADLDDLASSLVSLTVVTDPFAVREPKRLRESFPDLVLPFKQHFIFDPAQPLKSAVSPNHRYKAARALRYVTIHVCEPPHAWAATWHDLYLALVRRHDIRGVSRFSPAALTRQLEVPGLVMFRAEHDNQVVSMALWYVQDEVAYYHLAASSDRGYSVRASYGLFWRSLEFFQASTLIAVDLGAAAGRQDVADGLSRFKQGWATGQRTAYLCGRIFDHKRYEALTAATGKIGSSYFPAYRDGEFQ